MPNTAMFLNTDSFILTSSLITATKTHSAKVVRFSSSSGRVVSPCKNWMSMHSIH